jgi:hypothetical protein
MSDFSLFTYLTYIKLLLPSVSLPSPARDVLAGSVRPSRGSHWWVVGTPCPPRRTATPGRPGQPPEVRRRRGERRRGSLDICYSSMARGGAQLAATAVLLGLQRCGGHAALRTLPRRVAAQRAAHCASGSTHGPYICSLRVSAALLC